MAAKTLKCEQCGANLPPAEPFETVTCTFCGAASLVQPPKAKADKKTGPVVPQPTIDTRDGVPAGRGCSVAAASVGLMMAFVPLLGGLVALVATNPFLANVPGVSAVTAIPWEGVHGPILTDVNGDGTPDAVGRVRYVLPEDQVHLAAFDGATGARLWEGKTLGTYTETYQGTLVLAGTSLVFADAAGGLAAFELATGNARWMSSLPDVGKAFCQPAADAEDAAFEVVLADNRKLRISPDGGVRGTATDKDCKRLPEEADDLGSVEWDDRRSQRDLSVRGTIVAADGTRFVLGTRSTGTPVPRIRVVHADPALNWEADLASVKPLQTDLPHPAVGAANASAVFVAYEREGSMDDYHVVAFDRGGQRRWEIEVEEEGPLTSISATDRFIYISEWGRLTAFDAATGKKVWE